jgi:5-methylcytosine-specific restriction endonuclease McrA
MSTKKKAIRQAFRESVFARDGRVCRICGHTPRGLIEDELDAHHITDRHDMPHGGYVAANGIALCKVGNNCHLRAESSEAGFEAETLYGLIGSSKDEAKRQSEEQLGE